MSRPENPPPPTHKDVIQRKPAGLSRRIGNGLYGVDIKETNGRVVVIEVNDNPNLDYGCEDVCEKDIVWDKLVQWFVRRLDAHYSPGG